MVYAYLGMWFMGDSYVVPEATTTGGPSKQSPGTTKEAATKGV